MEGSPAPLSLVALDPSNHTLDTPALTLCPKPFDPATTPLSIPLGVLRTPHLPPSSPALEVDVD